MRVEKNEIGEAVTIPPGITAVPDTILTDTGVAAREAESLPFIPSVTAIPGEIPFFTVNPTVFVTDV